MNRYIRAMQTSRKDLANDPEWTVESVGEYIMYDKNDLRKIVFQRKGKMLWHIDTNEYAFVSNDTIIIIDVDEMGIGHAVYISIHEKPINNFSDEELDSENYNYYVSLTE